jgi:hypothetical protein
MSTTEKCVLGALERAGKTAAQVFFGRHPCADEGAPATHRGPWAF